MKKLMVIFFIVLIFTTLAGLITLYLYVPKTSITYTESKSFVEGPSRGFYVQMNDLDLARLEEIKNEGYDIILLAFDIKDYLNQPISNEKLEALETYMARIGELEMKVIFRAAYGFDGLYEDPKREAQMIEHLDQIAPIINEHDHSILSFQAGFIGPWGEWHNSKFLTGDNFEVLFRNRFIEALLDRLNDDIIINLRRPLFIKEAAEAGLNIKRLGFHNDGLLGSDTDLGTYMDNRKSEVEWINDNVLHGINGGEMPAVSAWTKLDVADSEFKRIGITYLNRMYNVEVLEDWSKRTYKGMNGLDYMSQHLGYRLFLQNLTVSSHLKQNRSFNLSFELKNSGFGPIAKSYSLYLLMFQGENIVDHQVISHDISQILGGQRKEFDYNVIVDELVYPDNLEPIKIALYITDDEYRFDYRYLSSDKWPSKFGKVELAHETNQYDQGLNYILTYIYEDKYYTIKK